MKMMVLIVTMAYYFYHCAPIAFKFNPNICSSLVHFLQYHFKHPSNRENHLYRLNRFSLNFYHHKNHISLLIQLLLPLSFCSDRGLIVVLPCHALLFSSPDVFAKRNQTMTQNSKSVTVITISQYLNSQLEGTHKCI